MTTWKKLLVAFILMIVLAGISFLFYWFYWFHHLDVYWDENGTITNGKLSYKRDQLLFQKYIRNEFKDGQTIGHFEGDHFWGFKTWVRSVKDHSDLITIHGLMYDDILKKTGN